MVTHVELHIREHLQIRGASDGLHFQAFERVGVQLLDRLRVDDPATIERHLALQRLQSRTVDFEVDPEVQFMVFIQAAQTEHPQVRMNQIETPFITKIKVEIDLQMIQGGELAQSAEYANDINSIEQCSVLSNDSQTLQGGEQMQVNDRRVELRETAAEHIQFEPTLRTDFLVEVKPVLRLRNRRGANGQLFDSHTAVDQRSPSSADRSGSRQVHKAELLEDLDQRQVRQVLGHREWAVELDRWSWVGRVESG